jgi:hypothetical protein
MQKIMQDYPSGEAVYFELVAPQCMVVGTHVFL